MAAYGFCECGCGEKTNLAPYSSKRNGWTKDQPVRFLPHHYKGPGAARVPNHIERFQSHAIVWIRSKGKLHPCLIDLEDLPKIEGKTWTLIPSGKRLYANYNARENGTIPMHRLLMGLSRGDGKEVDHLNGDGLDNRKRNLRLATRAEQMRNIDYPSKSGLRGVYLEKAGRAKPWKAQIMFQGKKRNLGRYASPEEGHQVVMKFIRAHGLLP